MTDDDSRTFYRRSAPSMPRTPRALQARLEAAAGTVEDGTRGAASRESHGGAPGKLSKIKQVRLAIAQTLTVMRHKQLNSLREAYAGAKYTPLDLRQKKTRAIRRALTKSEKGAKTVRQAKKDAAFPKRKYALKA